MNQKKLKNSEENLWNHFLCICIMYETQCNFAKVNEETIKKCEVDAHDWQEHIKIYKGSNLRKNYLLNNIYLEDFLECNSWHKIMGYKFYNRSAYEDDYYRNYNFQYSYYISNKLLYEIIKKNYFKRYRNNLSESLFLSFLRRNCKLYITSSECICQNCRNISSKKVEYYTIQFNITTRSCNSASVLLGDIKKLFSKIISVSDNNEILKGMIIEKAVNKTKKYKVAISVEKNAFINSELSKFFERVQLFNIDYYSGRKNMKLRCLLANDIHQYYLNLYNKDKYILQKNVCKEIFRMYPEFKEYKNEITKQLKKYQKRNIC